MSWDLVIFIAFIAVMAGIMYADRRNVKREGVALMRRTEKGKRFIDRLTKRHARFWNAMSFIGIAVALVALVAGFAFLINNTVMIVRGQETEGVRIVLPSPSSDVDFKPGLLLLPWWIWLLAIVSVVVPHELFHGIMCRLHNVRIKSLGWLLFLIVPGAFVEPDEAQLKKAPRAVKMKVYAAGSFANILVACIAFVLLMTLFSAFTPAGMPFIANESSAFGKNVSGYLVSLGGDRIVTHEDLAAALARHQPGDLVEARVVERTEKILPRLRLSSEVMTPVGAIDPANATSYTITVQARPDSGRAYLGVLVPQVGPGVRYDAGLAAAYMLLFWIFVMNLGIGIINILPLKPLDGGLLFEELASMVTPSRLLVKAMSGITLFLILFGIVGPHLF